MRILVMHGYGGNATWQRRRNWRLEQLLEPLGASFHYVDGPVLLPGCWDDGGSEDRRSWLREEHGDGAGQHSFGGWDESVNLLADVFARDGPFEGILGHSQGAACAAAVAVLMEAGLFPGSVNFLIAACGFLPEERGIRRFFPSLRSARARGSSSGHRGGRRQRPIQLPSLHIVGEADRVTPLRVNLKLAAMFKHAVMVRHDGAHWLELNTVVGRSLLVFLRPFVPIGKLKALGDVQADASELCNGCAAWSSQELDAAWPPQPGRWWCQYCWVDFRREQRWAEWLRSLEEEQGNLRRSSEELSPAELMSMDQSQRVPCGSSGEGDLQTRICDSCTQPSDVFGPMRGAPGDGAHAGFWYCSACWDDWEEQKKRARQAE